MRAAVASDPEVALGTPEWLEAGLDRERQRPRFLARLLTVFASFACVMALVGMHGVAPTDPRVLLVVTSALALTGLIAVWWPARQAALTDAAIVLKEE